MAFLYWHYTFVFPLASYTCQYWIFVCLVYTTNNKKTIPTQLSLVKTWDCWQKTFANFRSCGNHIELSVSSESELSTEQWDQTHEMHYNSAVGAIRSFNIKNDFKSKSHDPLSDRNLQVDQEWPWPWNELYLYLNGLNKIKATCICHHELKLVSVNGWSKKPMELMT